MPIFALVTIAPCLLVGAAAVLGGVWAWGALLYMTVLVASMDRLVSAASGSADPEAEFPASETLLVLLGGLHFAMLVAALWGVAGPSGLSVAERVALGGGAGLIFGQISHPVAHELIHKPARWMRWLGRWMYTSLLAGHHASAHLLIHHVHVGSDRDPNSAPRGETFYRYMARVTRQSFMTALALETARRARAGKSWLGHPFVVYVGGGAAVLGAVVAGFGWIGGLAFLSIVVHAQVQILMSDYVQHYGLRRIAQADGRLEPVGPQHAWNAPDVFSSALMVNAPRHSDHHMSPNRAYPALQLDPDAMPQLPYALPVMGVIALWPKLWFRLMNPLCDVWQAVPGEVAGIGGIRPQGPLGRNATGQRGGQAGAHLAHSSHAQTAPSLLSSGAQPHR
ncbi:MAG: alkane 1-monooxygenase [Pseudomonadota bacterium]